MRQITSLILAAGAAFAFAQHVYVGNEKVMFDAKPRLVNGTFMVPVRTMFEVMGVSMGHRTDREVIEGLKSGNRLELWMGSRQARLNDAREDMEQAPTIYGNRTFVPLKTLAKAFKYSISLEGGAYRLSPMQR